MNAATRPAASTQGEREGVMLPWTVKPPSVVQIHPEGQFAFAPRLRLRQRMTASWRDPRGDGALTCTPEIGPL